MPPAYRLVLELHTLASPGLVILARDLDIFAPPATWARLLAPKVRRAPGSGAGAGSTSSPPGLSSKVVGAGRPVARPAFTPDQAYDARVDRVAVDSIDMEPAMEPDMEPAMPLPLRSAAPMTALERDQIALATEASLEGASTLASYNSLRGQYVPSPTTTSDVGWGVVHLYKDNSAEDGAAPVPSGPPGDGPGDDCTTLGILAVPSYMTPSDLLGWLGNDSRSALSHLRLVRTQRANRYMALLKFRDAARARAWQRGWSGKLFNSTEPEDCQVVFIKAVTVQPPGKQHGSFPSVANDPFAPKAGSKTDYASEAGASGAGTSTSLTSKPAPPPTPALVELPTCPVCLERMDDEASGLATIFCQHVFHCACLEKWRGSGCPVCRYTQDDPLHLLQGGAGRSTTKGMECSACRLTESLWICLICGLIGCGRYEEAHAFAHFEATGHAFAMDLKTQAIWDYYNDEWVHRLIQSKLDGHLIQLPPAHAPSKEKIEEVSAEYLGLIKGQLDSQRVYFQEQLDRAVDKASRAAASAEASAAEARQLVRQTDALTDRTRALEGQVAAAERDRDRLGRRADKAEGRADTLHKQAQESAALNDALMQRVAHLNGQVTTLTAANADLQEQNRDLTFFISGSQRLAASGEDVEQGTVSVGAAKKKGKAKK